MATRRLRPYFHAHPVKVLTDLPLKHVLTKPEASGRIAKWAVELGEHSIDFAPRLAIKGQALADFLVEAKFTTPEETPKALPDKETPPDPPVDCWQMYVDGASGKTGSGAGILLIDPEGSEVSHRLRFCFPTTNNEVEYEALISGLRIATELKVPAIKVFSDSQVVVSHLLGTYEAKGEKMKKYLTKANQLKQAFSYFAISRIPRCLNERADALSKLASTGSAPFEEILERSIDEAESVQVIDEDPNWMTPIHQYLNSGVLPSDKTEARKIQLRSPRYEIRDGVLYRRSHMQPLLRCLGPTDANYILREIHEGCCGSHIGARALSKKVLLQGFYWPTIFHDAGTLIKACPKCQFHGVVPRLPQHDLVGMQSPWPFAQWGIDLVGPFNQTPRSYKYLIVAVDYFTKWVEAEPLRTITGDNILHFFWKNVVCRFGIPHILVSDNGTQFVDKKFRKWCDELNIKQRFTSVAHPQANGQTEVTNRIIIQGLKRTLDDAKGLWVDELPGVLWSYRTTPRTANGETPFSLVYGSEAVLPPEIGIPSLRTLYYSESDNDTNRRLDLDLVEERRQQAFIKEARYKAQVARYYNRRVKHRQFQVGDLVLRNNEVSRAQKLGKLEATWEGPYRVDEALGKGSYRLVTLSGQPIPRTWHITHLKKYYVGG